MGIKNGDVINLNTYMCDELCNKTIIINEDINEITLTSNRKVCNFKIFVKKRNSDLVVNINDLVLDSKEDIAINFASGEKYDYKNYLVFSGINSISSGGNIAICVTNNQTLEIKGKEDGFLKLSGGCGIPTIGSSFYTEGSGNLVFSGQGFVEIISGKSDYRYKNSNILGSGCGIGFYNSDIEDTSSITILDDINVKIVGESGKDVESISEDKIAYSGGDGIYIKNSGVIEKKGNGLLEINAGNGGSCIGNYSSGVCGNGGCAICMGEGTINIDNNAVLKAGDGGGVKDKYEFSMVKGGNAGDIISLTEQETAIVSSITMGDNIKVILGNGGDSGSFIDGKVIRGFDGGNSGSIVNSNGRVKVKVDNINIAEGIGGRGGNISDINDNGQNGRLAEKYLGDGIELIEKEKETEKLLKDIEDLQNKEEKKEKVEETINKEDDNLDVEYRESETVKDTENLEEEKVIQDENEENNEENSAIEENIIEINKESGDNEGLENIDDENKDEEKEEIKEQDNKETKKRSIWQAIKRFFGMKN